VEDGGDLLDFLHEIGEFGRENGLDAVGEGFFGLVMDFDQEAIGTYGDCRAGEWKNLVAFASAVRWIDEDGEVAAFFYRGDYSQVERVAGKIGEGADAAFAKHDVVVAFAENVFGSHQEFVESGGHAAFQEDGKFGAAGTLEKRKILHVARADLNDVGIFLDKIERFVVDGFGNDAEAKFLADVGKNLQAGEAESLKGIRRGARLVGTAAKEPDAGRFELLGDGEALVFGFNGAWSGNHSDVSAADEDVAGGSGNFDDGVVFFDVARDKFVGLGNGNAFDDAGHGFENAEVDGAGISSDADGSAAGSGHGVGFKSERFDAIANSADLFVGGVGLHDNEHGRPRFWCEGVV
jgi:hypothetical protein